MCPFVHYNNAAACEWITIKVYKLLDVGVAEKVIISRTKKQTELRSQYCEGK